MNAPQLSFKRRTPQSIADEYRRTLALGNVIIVFAVERRPIAPIVTPYPRAWRSCRAGEGFTSWE